MVKAKIALVHTIVSLVGLLTASDIVNDLTTGGTDKPLSVEQSKALKVLIQVAATSGIVGIVKQMTKIGNLVSEDPTEAINKINKILAGLKTALIMSNS